MPSEIGHLAMLYKNMYIKLQLIAAWMQLIGKYKTSTIVTGILETSIQHGSWKPVKP